MRLLSFHPRRIFVLLVVLLLINSLCVPLSVSKWYSKWPASLLETLTVPFTRRLNGASNRIRDGFSRDRTDAVEAIADSQRLHRIVLKLRQELVEAHQEIERLSGVRQRFALTEMKILAAHVVSVGTDQLRRTLTIDRGALRGVRQGHVVGVGLDLVGRVASTGPSTATVQLIMDRATDLTAYVVSPIDDVSQRLVATQLRYDANRGVFVGNVSQSRDGDNVRVGDYALPADPRWPDEARQLIVGYVVAIEKHEDNPSLLRRIIVKPQSDPAKLTKVFVFMPVTADLLGEATNR